MRLAVERAGRGRLETEEEDSLQDTLGKWQL